MQNECKKKELFKKMKVTFEIFVVCVCVCVRKKILTIKNEKIIYEEKE